MHTRSALKSLVRAGLCTTMLIAAGSAAFASNDNFTQCGKASWYKLGGTTASGEPANPNGLTAAHRTLPFGTMVEVTNLSNGKSVTVRINDRGPYSKGRVIDVTYAAAKKLGFIRKGITKVHVSDGPKQVAKNTKQFCR
ncbi:MULTISPECIES: septal ring lytic transglycosylase RlpA family protein [Stappiaceae]|nr:RlpA-like protein precursor [Labrenzia sp. THAF82]